MTPGPKVIGLAGFGLQVPDISVAKKFYTSFGLTARNHGAALGLQSSHGSGDEIVIMPGSAAKKMHHVSFIIAPGDIDSFNDKLHKLGFHTQSAPDGAPREGLWFQDPWGTWINLTPGPSPYYDDTHNKPAEAVRQVERIDVAHWQELNRNPNPDRIGHLLMFTPDLEKSEKFFNDVLGMRTSDRAAGKASFISAGDGVIDHHCFGLVPSTHRGLQHASFKVGSIDDIGFGVWRMREAGYKESFGPGRHALASNLFHYLRDPWGSWVEYYADMDRISDAWQCRDFEELPYIWGPEWAPEFWTKEMNGNMEPK